MHVVQSQLLGVAFSFLRNFGMLSGASGIFGILSTGVASIGMDQRCVPLVILYHAVIFGTSSCALF